MNPYSNATLLGCIPYGNGGVTIDPFMRPEKPYNPNGVASYQLYMNVVFVPDAVFDLKRLAGVTTIHELFSDEGACQKLAIIDRAFLIAFHGLVIKALNLNPCHADGYYFENTATQLARDAALMARLESQYFHQNSYSPASAGDLPDISTEYHTHLGHSIAYVVLSPGVLTTQFDPETAPVMSELLTDTCNKHLRVLRECLKPFNSNNPKESIAMCDPSGTYSAYLALLNVS